MTLLEAIAMITLIVAVLGLLGAIMTVWSKLNVKIAEIIKDIEKNRVERDLKIQDLHTGTSLKVEGIKKEIAIEVKGLEEANRIKIEAIKAEIELRVNAIKSGTKGMTDFFAQRIAEFISDNKGDHEEIKKSIEKLFDVTGRIDKALGKLEK